MGREPEVTSAVVVDPSHPGYDPRSLLSTNELEAAATNVAAASRLSPAQLDVIADIFGPVARRWRASGTADAAQA